MKKLMLLVILLSVVTFGILARDFTDDLFLWNGTDWQQLSEYEKGFFIQGLMIGLYSAARAVEAMNDTLIAYQYVVVIHPEKVIKALDDIYEEEEVPIKTPIGGVVVSKVAIPHHEENRNKNQKEFK